METIGKRSEVEIARVAANWWTNFLKDPMTATFDNGDTSRTGSMSKMMAEMGRPKQYDPEKIEEFFHSLVLELCTNQPSTIHVDYSPDYVISSLMNKIFTDRGWNNMSSFPCKTNMWINWTTGKIQVSKGYRAADEEI